MAGFTFEQFPVAFGSDKRTPAHNISPCPLLGYPTHAAFLWSKKATKTPAKLFNITHIHYKTSFRKDF